MEYTTRLKMAHLLSPGGLGDWSEDQLLERTRAVAKEMPVVGFYLQKAVGGRKLSRDYWQQLADIPNVVAIKCACFDRYRTQDLVKGVMESHRWEDVALYPELVDDAFVARFLAQDA